MVEPGGTLPTEEELPSNTADGAPSTPESTAAINKQPPSGGKLPSGKETPSGAADGATSTPKPTAAITKEPSQAHSLSAGAIAGIAIGVIAIMAISGGLLFFLGTNRKEVQFLRRDLHKEQRKSMRLEKKNAVDDITPKSPMISYPGHHSSVIPTQ